MRPSVSVQLQVDDDVQSLREERTRLRSTVEKRDARILQLEENLAQVCSVARHNIVQHHTVLHPDCWCQGNEQQSSKLTPGALQGKDALTWYAMLLLTQVKEERNNLQRMSDELLDRDASHSSGRAGSASPGKHSSLSTFRSSDSSL
jgi:hypothetical protein